jgi:hypothetical protein
MLAAIARTTVKKSRRLSRKFLSRALLNKMEEIFLCRYNFEDPHGTYQDPSELTLMPAIRNALALRGVFSDPSYQQDSRNVQDLQVSPSRELLLASNSLLCLYESQNILSRASLPKISSRDYYLGN